MNNEIIKKFSKVFSLIGDYARAPILIICVSNILFFIAKFSHEALASYRNDDYSSVNAWICLLITVLFSYSIFRTIVKHNEKLREKYWKRESKLDFKQRMIFIFRESGLISKSIVTALVYLILPIKWTHPALTVALKIGNSFTDKLIALSAFLPILLIIAILSELSTHTHWQKYQSQTFYGKNTEIKDALTIALAYVPGEFLLINSIPFIDSNRHIFKQLLTVKLFLAIIIPVIIIVACIYLRAILKRRKCINELRRICRGKGYTLSDIKDPYRSVFKICEGESFNVSIGSKCYSCKLIGSRSSLSPIALYPNGTLVFLEKNPLKVTTTIYKFAYDSEHLKILIINPTPKHVYASQTGGRLVKIDNGDRVGKYKFYTATAFLRALELDVLDR